jgi:tetratricopeptide (TPR) repeat protein
MVELVGETGSGKSRLLSEARALAADFRFVHTTGETYTQMTPYASWRDPLRQLLGLSWNDSDDVVLARLRHELDTHHPDLRPWLPLLAIALDAEAPSTPEVDQLAPDFRAAKLHEVVLLFLAPAFAIPTLVQVEHAHQLDAASASLLEALAGELERSSWLVLVTRREAEQGFVAPAGTSQRLELEPLTQDDLRTLAEHTPEAHLIPPHLLELAVQRSGGSPEFLLDLLAAGAAGGEDESLPDNLESAAMIRIDALEPSDRSLVRRASVLGVSFHPRRLAQVLESGSAGLDADAASRLSGIFAYDPDGHVRFKRPALRDVAYASLPFRLRRQLHAALADALERDIGLDVDADPAVVSLHFILAGDPEKAWRYALVGADRATELSAHADAAQLYQRAIEAGRADGASEAELASAWEKLAEALRSTGQPDAAHTALTMARRIDPGDPLRDARLLYAHAEICEQTGRLSASVRWVSRGLRAIEGLEDREAVAWRARLQSRLAGIRSRQGRPKEAERIARRVILDAEAADALYALAHACYVLDWALVELGRASEAVHSARALEIFRSLGDLNREAYVLNNLGMFAYFRGSWDEAIDLYRESARCAAKAGDAAAPAFAEMNIAEILSDQGRLEEAAEHLNRCRRILASTRDQDSVPFVDVLLGRLAVRAGRPHDALEPLENAREQFLRMRLAVDAEFASLVIAEAHTFGGNPSEALRTLNALRSTRDPYVAMAHRLRGISKALLGDRAAAIKELSASLAAARERKAEYDIASALDALEQLGPPAPERQVERDALLARLGVARLLRLQPDRAPVG